MDDTSGAPLSGFSMRSIALSRSEFGKAPCVVGTYVGTQVLKDGQRITVDGAQGIVRIES